MTPTLSQSISTVSTAGLTQTSAASSSNLQVKQSNEQCSEASSNTTTISPTKWIIKQPENPVLLQVSSSSHTPSTVTLTSSSTSSSSTSQAPPPATIASQSQGTLQINSTIPTSASIKPEVISSNHVTIQPAPTSTLSSSPNEIKTSMASMSTTISVTPSSSQPNSSQTSVNVNINVKSDTSAFAPETKPRVRRVACTCPNCTMPERSTDRKKQHICHVAGCNKVYGKTSHLRAHLRWHTGKIYSLGDLVIKIHLKMF